MNRGSALKRAFGEFLRTTTLHGFKYLRSQHCIDWVGWVVVCAASTCCAGVLCAVLWARFLQEPALLELQDIAMSREAAGMPRIALCPPIHALVQHMSLLTDQNLTLADMLLKYSPACSDLIVGCRWQGLKVTCEDLFDKQLSVDGVCCIMRPDTAFMKLNEPTRPSFVYTRTVNIDLALQCSNETSNGCKFYAKYDDETNVQRMTLAPGYIYAARMSFDSVPMSASEDFVESNCVSSKGYLREICQDKCAEEFCGCSDPFRQTDETEEVNDLPKCSIKQLRCLRTSNEEVFAACGCLPLCNKITSDINVDTIPMNLDIFTVDPMYESLNAKSTVIHFQLDLRSSKIFSLNPTETWLTLLSSLGGVFNMFLGVGLFSALEIICFLLFKLPSILLQSRYI